MQRSKRLFALLLAGMLTLSAVGCSMSSDSGKTDSNTVSESDEKKDDAKKKEKEKPSPQDDFYDHVNFDSLKEMEIPYGEIYTDLYDSSRFTDQVEDIIKEIGKSSEDYADGSNEQLIHDVYQQYLTYKENVSIENDIMDNCKKILATENVQELFKLWGELARKYGASSIFNFRVDRDYLDGSKYSLYIEPVQDFLGCSIKDISEKTKDVSPANDIARDMLRAMGDEYEAADEKGRQMCYLGINIAYATDVDLKLTMEMLLELEKKSFAELDDLMNNIDGSVVEMFYGDAVKNTDGIYIVDEEQLKKINELITDENLEKWQTYVLTSYLSDFGGFIRESNDILSDYNPVSKNTEEDQAVSFVKQMLREQIGELYAEVYYTPELDKGIHELFDEIIGSYDELITNADWLSSEARTLLKKKLHNITLITVPEPHKIDPEDAKLIGADKYETIQNMFKRKREKDIAKLATEVDRNVPDMNPAEYNAQYLPCNSINITVAIMQKPMFDPNGDHAENLGGLGSVVGHEIGHAFDSTLMKYNAEGKYDPEWLPEVDRQALSVRADAMAEYYDGYTIMEVYHVDGKLTSGENYADVGAVECITNIIDDKDELERLFTSYAKSWCSLMVDSDGIDQIFTDEHSPSKVRVNAVLSSNEKFNEVYGLKEGDGMYVAPEERVSRW